MSYERCVATYQAMCEKHKADPGALAIVHNFGQDVAYMRISEVFSSAEKAFLTIEKAKASSQAD